MLCREIILINRFESNVTSSFMKFIHLHEKEYKGDGLANRTKL